MRLTAQPRYWFYPVPGDSLRAEIIRPTGSQMGEFSETVVTQEYHEKKDSEGKREIKKTSGTTRINVDYILRTNVGKIENLIIDEVVDDKGATREYPVTNGAELAECRAYGIEQIISKICVEVQSDKMTTSEKKIIESPFAPFMTDGSMKSGLPSTTK